MFDFEIANYLYKMSKIQSIYLNSPYRAKAYYSAGVAVDAYECYIEYMYSKKKLTSIPFVGNKIEKHIIEIIETGEFSELKKYEEQYHIKDYSLLLSHGLSDALLKKLFSLSVQSVYELFDMAYLNNLKTQLTKNEYDKIVLFVKEYKNIDGKYLFAHGLCLAKELTEYLKKIKNVRSIQISGEMLTSNEKINKIDMTFVYDGSWDYLVRKLKKCPRINNVCGKNKKEICGKTNFGIPFILTCVENACTEPKDSYKFLDIKFKGDLHTHTSWTDGIHSIEEMAQAAKDKNYEYLAITDHSVSMRIAHGLSESQALSQLQAIRTHNEKQNFKLLAGIEVDILPDGSLDYSNDVLYQFDFVIAAIHSQLNQDAAVLYNRLERALSNPCVNILAHPTGRLLGRPGVLFCEREACRVSMQSIIDLCKKNHVVLEVNCFPERFDLNSENIALAVAQGVKISFGTDAHSVAHLCNLEYSSYLMRDLSVQQNMILNTYSYNDIVSFFKDQRNKSETSLECSININPKNFFYYFSNNSDIIEGKKSIVGIDLTGSENKESGWAYMASNQVYCKRLKSDEDILAATIEASPDIISIDSPLAYPEGRCCAKKDCSCAKLGIMRKSERMLRHFGIMVYPCLIDSMVNLTTRGMKLAKVLRNLGYTVIESYPGVAQDILLIPRKGKTEEQFSHLKLGLRNFGIVGDLIDNPLISHDEVDAITSALVGYFYLNKQYVGLGNEAEDYLIVPRIQEEFLQRRVIIGLSGETGAGKTTTADYLQFKYGLKYFRYSKVISEKYQLKEKAELQQIGAEIAKDSKKQRELTKYMIERMEPNKSYVIDGLRHKEDYDELKNAFGGDFIFIYVDCSYINRYKRYNKLHRNQISKESFRDISSHKAEESILSLLYFTDYRVNNNKGFKDLRAQIDTIVKNNSIVGNNDSE